MFVGHAAEVRSRGSRTLPGRQVLGIEAGGGAAPAEVGERGGRQENDKRKGDEAERDAGHKYIIPCRFIPCRCVWYNGGYGQCDNFRAAGGPGLSCRGVGGD